MHAPINERQAYMKIPAGYLFRLMWCVALERAALLGAVLLLAGCFGTQVFPNLHERSISLRPGDLEASGVAFITPSAATGQEEEKQAIALVFADILQKQRPRIRVVPLAEALNAVNKAGLTELYKRMYNDYRDTGLFDGDTLKKVGSITGARYIVQIKLQGFAQNAKERFGIFGFRIVETKYTNLRIFVQIWDSEIGAIAWEGMQELVYAEDRVSEETITLQTATTRVAKELLSKVP